MFRGDGDIKLANLTEIPDGEARAYPLDDYREVIVVRQGERVYGYMNSCPHTGVALNWLPDQFLSEDGAWLHCANHGALFRIEDGFCVAGPCQGQSLLAIGLTVTADGTIRLGGKPE